MKANFLILNKRNELIFTAGNQWAPMGAYATKDLEAALLAHGADEIRVQFTTTLNGRDEDLKTYTARLRKLALFKFDEFRTVVHNGHEAKNTFSTVLTRTAKGTS